MSNPNRYGLVLWAVVTGVLLGSLITITVLQVPLWLQQVAVGFMFMLYVLVMVSGLIIPMPPGTPPRHLARTVRFQRYPYHSTGGQRAGALLTAKKEK